MNKLLFTALFSFVSLSAHAGPTCAEYFRYKAAGTDWPYALPMRDFAHNCEKENPIWKRCQPVSTCATVEAIRKSSDSSGESYVCSSGKQKFNCTSLIKNYGIAALGLKVEVEYQTIDTCHKAGACGQSACRVWNWEMGSAAESAFCRN